MGFGSHHEPERTCVGCRSKAAKADLVRVARDPEGRVTVDQPGRLGGRGAYVHRKEECLARASRSGALERALKARLTPAQAATLMKELRESIGEHA
jgi:predicted RNA-binding protein YlxR (DUF448 family)